MTVVAYQGEPGANSHMAALEAFPGADALPCATFEDAFAAVDGGEAQFAMIPIDNTVAGRVADIHLLLPTTSLQIVGEHFLRIRFSLMGVPGSTIEGAREVHSHVHALAQALLRQDAVHRRARKRPKAGTTSAATSSAWTTSWTI